MLLRDVSAISRRSLHVRLDPYDVLSRQYCYMRMRECLCSVERLRAIPYFYNRTSVVLRALEMLYLHVFSSEKYAILMLHLLMYTRCIRARPLFCQVPVEIPTLSHTILCC